MFAAIAQGEFGGGFWSLIWQSSPIGIAVLLILFFFSVLSWTIIFKKWRLYKQVEEHSSKFYEEFRKNTSLSEIYRSCQRYPLSPLAGIFGRVYDELDLQINSKKEDGDKTVASLNGLERSLRQASASEMTTLETSLSWLATTGSVTPFIGLFGTVVGIINAFQGLGMGGATTIQAVAPGISEALVATAAGLFAAIPAVIFYNHYVNRLKIFAAEMDDFSVDLLNTIERSIT